MSKNFADIYASQNDGIALVQKFFIKEETTRGVVALPTLTDFLYTLNGASVNYMQPVESSPHKSGRHHNSVIKQKTETSWKMPLFFNIDSTLGAASLAEIDPAARVLYKSLFGKEDTSGSLLKYSAAKDPDTTFTLFENGDVFAKQAVGAFVESGSISLPGNGQAKNELSGHAKTALTVGMGKSTVANTGNVVTVATGEGLQFPVGAEVMIIKANGTSRSADTPTGTARKVTSVTGDAVTLDGAVLADADGSTTPIYLTYYEPSGSITAINDPQTGLEGSVSIVGLGTPLTGCVRSATLALNNNHQLMNDCYGTDGLGGTLFVPGGRFTPELTLELNLDKALVGYINSLKTFQGKDITLVLGPPSGRRMEIYMPKVIFAIPEIAVPDTGTIPVSFKGNAYQSALDAADEVLLSFK